MDWFFEKRGKSVASNAQRIVADMHRHLDTQTKKAAEIEAILTKFKELNVHSLEKEITRLHKRKADLVSELDEVDKAIIDATSSLQDLQDRMDGVLALPSTSEVSQLQSNPAKALSPSKHQEFSEESKIQKVIQSAHPKSLFYIHQNRVDSILIFVATLKEDALIEARVLVDYRDDGGRELTQKEDAMYGVDIVPNHQRDFPHVTEMKCPSFLVDKAKGEEGSPGSLICAFELGLTSAVVIDVWQNSDGLVWATSTVDAQSFAVLDRLFVKSEVSWGIESIVQVDLCGRHPVSGAPIVEHVSASDDNDDEA
jgi:hypothetical protein